MFRRNRSRNNSRESSPVPPPAAAAVEVPAPPFVDVWNSNSSSTSSSSNGGSRHSSKKASYFVQPPWAWVMQSIAMPHMTAVESVADLPSMVRSLQHASATATTETPSTTRRRRMAKKSSVSSATLKLEICDEEGNLEFAAHGNSAAMDSLDDKDELVRALQRCRCDHLNITPPSVLLNWDVTHEECLNVVGKDLPCLDENKDVKKYAVLKEPMGSQGQGIYFVSSAEEIYTIVERHHKRAAEEPELLDTLIEAKGRIPSWVIQAEVNPALLIKDRRKFHIRSYVAVVERPHLDNLVEVFVYNRHEVRIAGVPVPTDGLDERDPIVHITNGAMCNTTERLLLRHIGELMDRNLHRTLDVFLAETFGKQLLPEMARRINWSASQGGGGGHHGETLPGVEKFALAGLDLMITENGRLYLLEVNVNPAAPVEATVDDVFREHLQGLMRDLIDLVAGKPVDNFVSAQAILVREGLMEVS